LQTALDSILGNPSLGYRLIDKNIVIYKINSSISDFSGESGDKSSSLRIKGIIMDKEDKDPLPFATILIQGSRKGTVSNLKGEFSLFIPSQETTFLEIAMMGYKNAYIPIYSNQAEGISIEMERDVVSLQEVIIRYQNPVDILHKTIENIPENYLNEHASITAYFREYVQRNADFITYSEAVLGIDKSPYNQPFTLDETRLIKGRKLENIPVEDSLLLKIQSGVSSSLQLDIVKNSPLFLSRDFEEHYDLQFRNMIHYRDRQVYVISFEPVARSEDAFYQGDLYISSDDLSLVAAEFSITPEELRKEPERFLVKKSRSIKARTLKASYRTEYRQTEGKYHISLVSGEVIFKLRRKKQWLSSRYRIGIEMAVTDIQPGIRERISRKDRLKPSAILAEQEFSYDPSFWGEYNIIEPEASLKDAMKKMGIEWKDFED
ncbi:MAG: carboxypeptidase-like regulatory domain-containing protein, partial [Bacteroidales bacterium]|nr:carboxypeptidase-like regulatory domain-containing protein [Bacteroidales bacterium]